VRASQLQQVLNKKVGEEQLEFRIPQIFLPPRFRDLSEGRDLLLMLDDDLTIHIRWNNEGFHTHHPLTPGAARRLVGEIMKHITEYKKSLRVFGTFINGVAEEPWDEERYHDGFRKEEETAQRAKEVGAKEEEEQKTAGQEAEQVEVETQLHTLVQDIDKLIELARG
jgi:hypothetical protein